MKIQDIMSAEPTTVTPDTPITEAARMMKDHNIGMLPVVESEGSRRLVGVVTDRDIAIRHVAEGHTSDCPVREAMTEKVSTCTPDENVERVMNLMAEEQVRRIPIVEEGSVTLTPQRHAFSVRAGAQNLGGWLQSYRATLGVRRYEHS